MSLKIYKLDFDLSEFDKDALSVVDRLQRKGGEAYFVGGCVRDLYFNTEPKDFDVVTNLSPRKVHSIFRNSRLIGRRFRLVHVTFKGGKFLEVATFRRGASKVSPSGIIIRENDYGTIEEDAPRRDFSINALYYNPATDEILDYVGGMRDMKRGKLKTLGHYKRSFISDPVRMIRALRFEVEYQLSLSLGARYFIRKNHILLSRVPPARLNEEYKKLQRREKSEEIFKCLERYGILPHLHKAVDKAKSFHYHR